METTDAQEPYSLDLRGVRCPLNWAKAKVYIETLPLAAYVELLLDDPKGVRDIPQAAEAEGYSVVTCRRVVAAAPPCWRLLLQK